MGNKQLEIIGFEDSMATKFAELNQAWMKKYFAVEAADEKMLSDPRSNIIEREVIFFLPELLKKLHDHMPC